VSAQTEAQAESVKEKQTEVIEIDLDLDEDGEQARGEKLTNKKMGELKEAEKPPSKEKTMGARRVTRAAAAEGVGVKEIDLRGSHENERTPEKSGSGRYPERGRKPPGWLRASEEETIWITPRANKGSDGRAKKG
jgi:hypothetical protein